LLAAEGTTSAAAAGSTGASRGLIVLTAMLMAGGGFVILRAAISHDQFARRLDDLCRELEASNARLEDSSFKDEVTDLYNRRFFALRLEDEVSRYCRFDHPVSVALLDVDGLKAINDELGQEAGDETLRGVADLLLKHSRGIDVICRYGGDEFIVLLVETPKEAALRYAERIRGLIASRSFAGGRRLTVSIGVACLPTDVSAVPEDLVSAADWGLYAAKRAGKNRVGDRTGAVEGAVGDEAWAR
jgi:diguanylate cyclase (GGDEF)-like protein